jgi:hypothetical protein
MTLRIAAVCPPAGLWVATYFVAALRRSDIGLLGAFGQKPDQRS